MTEFRQLYKFISLNVPTIYKLIERIGEAGIDSYIHLI